VPDSDLDYAKVTGRLALSVADGSDPGDNPDIIYCDSGTVRITPLINFTRVADATPPFTVGHAAIDATVEPGGYVTWNGQPFVWVVDLTSEKVNPRIPEDAATHKLEFFNVTADGTVVKFPTSTVRFTKDGLDGSGVNDLALVMPVTEGASTPIVRGAQGVGIQSAEVSGGNLLLGLSDGTEIDAGELPVGPGGTDAGVASYVANTGSDTYAKVADTVATVAGSNLGRFIARCRAGQAVKIATGGDSIPAAIPGVNSGGVMGVDDLTSYAASLIAARFGNIVTTANQALSGHTVATGPLSVKWNALIAEQADLYLFCYGTNDWSADDFTTPVPGYKTPASLAGLERLFRRIRTEVPKADIAFLIANPYTSADSASNNVGKKAYNKKVRDVCAAYGVEVVDGYQAFIDHPDRASLMFDSTHPNGPGHRVLGEEIAKHVPAAFAGQTSAVAAVPSYGLAKPEQVDPAIGDTGAQYVLAPTANTWVESGGGWTTSGSDRVSSTVGATITCTTSAVEFYAMLSTTAADAARVTVQVDGVDVWTNIDLTIGKQGTYWVPLITTVNNLTPGSHAFKIVLVSGTLRVSRIGWLAAKVGAFTPAVKAVTLSESTTPVTILDTGASTNVFAATTITSATLGFGTALAHITGTCLIKVTGETTTSREIETSFIIGTTQALAKHTIPPVAAGATYFVERDFSFLVDIGTGASMRLVARVLSTDKTGVTVDRHSAKVLVHRQT
jgi:lysophospholipase L1-like esterase